MAKDEINAFLGAGTVYEGKLSFQGSVRIDGAYTGQIESEGALIVGKDAIIKGDVCVGELLLSGRFEGEVKAARRVVVHKGGIVEGTVHTPALIMEEGGLLEGQVHMQGSKTSEK